MNMSNSSDTQMTFMWIFMGVMFVMEVFMFYIHAKTHKRVQQLEQEIAALKDSKK
jgi:preprotein translocase subunit YajC